MDEAAAAAAIGVMMSPWQNLGITDVACCTPGASPPGWRDPRLWIGVAIVAASVVVGALVLGTSDDTVAVWAAADTLGAGPRADRRRPGRTPGAASPTRRTPSLYFRADEQLPADLRLQPRRGRRRAAAARRGGRGRRPRRCDRCRSPWPPTRCPARSGSATSSTSTSARRRAAAVPAPPVCNGRPVLGGVTVLDAPPADAGVRLATAGGCWCSAMRDAEAQRFFRLLASTDDAALTVVGRG